MMKKIKKKTTEFEINILCSNYRYNLRHTINSEI